MTPGRDQGHGLVRDSVSVAGPPDKEAANAVTRTAFAANPLVQKSLKETGWSLRSGSTWARGFIVVASLSLLLMTAAVFPAFAPAQQSRPPSREKLALQLRDLRAEVAEERSAREQLSDDSSMYFEFVAIIVAVASLIIAVIAVVVGFLGVRAIRQLVDDRVAGHAAEQFKKQGIPRLEEHFAELKERYDSELDELFGIYKAATRDKNPGGPAS